MFLSVKEDNVQITEYTKKIKNWLDPFLIEEPPLTTKRCCIQISSKRLSCLYINKTSEVVELLSTTSVEITDLDSLSLILPTITKQNDLKNSPVYWLLAPEDYQLFLIETLPVHQEEFEQALRWRIRSLISFPIEEAIIDHFFLPPKKNTANPMVAAVVSRKNNFQPMIDLFNQINLNLKIITIPELALCHLTTLYENDERSTAMLYFHQNMVILNITREKTLYFTYRLNWNNSANPVNADYEQLTLDIMRYFDYFQGQWRHPSPSRVFIISEQLDDEKIATALSEHLLMPVERYVPQSSPVLTVQEKCSQLERTFLLPFGCALSEEKIYATPKS